MSRWIVSKAKFESDAINPKLAVSPWCGHRNFVYDLILFMKPSEIVELGTHYGCSLFAMCQSIKDNALPSHIYAVDTWLGDEQAGFYGEEVWETVNKTVSSYFSGISVDLMRMRFEEAVDQFENESIDLIHIDGLHTHEAVQRDFTTWLPKLKKNGIVLFHDIHSALGYGTNLYWKELKQRYAAYFEFEQSWGLGVLFPKGDEYFRQMLDAGFEDKRLIYTYRALYELETIKTADLTRMADERYAAIGKQSRMIDERDKAIKAQTAMIDERDETIKAQAAMIDERDKAIKAQAAMLEERYAAMEEQSRMIDERDKAIKEQAAMIDERDKTIKAQAAMLEGKP